MKALLWYWRYAALLAIGRQHEPGRDLPANSFRVVKRVP